ncbi:RbsD/FucU domain-containing protein [Rhabdaerophilum sp. SD176]|uniref:RbsD/FucU family protein n=1 Tax=Rhabdaerophilum sp. SD176 TaxID=2983548 RepID=UPI0024DF630C|nr:RbsD/FucU domain-containing protein [Rhabdaerophilum sp. SD176]
MLKGIDPRLSPDLLHLLARMGHGDDLAIVDANHPAESVAASTVTGELVRLPGLAVDSVLEAVLTLFPLDDFTEDPVRFMQVVGDPEAHPEAIQSMELVARRAGYAGPFHALERFAFYAAAKSSFAVVQCGEQRLYGNVLIRMGALAPG